MNGRLTVTVKHPFDVRVNVSTEDVVQHANAATKRMIPLFTKMIESL